MVAPFCGCVRGGEVAGVGVEGERQPFAPRFLMMARLFRDHQTFLSVDSLHLLPVVYPLSLSLAKV